MIIFKERAVRLFHLDRHLHSPIFCLPANLFTFLAHFPRLPSFLTCSLAVRNMIRLGPKNKTPTREIAFDEICYLIGTQDIFLTPSLAKTRGPSENHICSFIAPSIPRSWQFGANLGGEGQKLPPPPKIAVSGEELAVVEMMQKVAVVVEMMHFLLQKLMLAMRLRRVVANRGKVLKAHSIAKHLSPSVVGFSLQLGISLFVFCPIAIQHSLPFHPMFGFLFR